MSMFLVKQRFEQYLQKVALLYSPPPPPQTAFCPGDDHFWQLGVYSTPFFYPGGAEREMRVSWQLTLLSAQSCTDSALHPTGPSAQSKLKTALVSLLTMVCFLGLPPLRKIWVGYLFVLVS